VVAGAAVGWFPHAPHVAEGLECGDCHELATDGVRHGMPAPDMCTDCHETPPPQPAAPRADRARRRGELRFAHRPHREAASCADCHRGVSAAGAGLPAPTGADCLGCHAARDVAGSCTDCHGAARFRPAGHDQGWARRHGRLAGLRATARHGERCADCHRGDGCRACHQRQQPRDHTGYWRLRGHGLRAAGDRERCAACHVEAYCIRCHRETPPQSHRGGQWVRRHGQVIPGWLAGELGNCQLCHALGFCARCHSRSR